MKSRILEIWYLPLWAWQLPDKDFSDEVGGDTNNVSFLRGAVT